MAFCMQDFELTVVLDLKDYWIFFGEIERERDEKCKGKLVILLICVAHMAMTCLMEESISTFFVDFVDSVKANNKIENM